MTEPPTTIVRFIRYVEERVKADDRGFLADLRCGFNPGLEYRAWPHLAPWCNLADHHQRTVWQTIAAGLALHRGSSRCGNFGRSLRAIAIGGAQGAGEDALSTFEPRFRRLLTCNDAAEVCRRLPGILRALERSGVPVDYERLFWDLLLWDKDPQEIKVRWAAGFWGSPRQEAESGAGTEVTAEAETP